MNDPYLTLVSRHLHFTGSRRNQWSGQFQSIDLLRNKLSVQFQLGPLAGPIVPTIPIDGRPPESVVRTFSINRLPPQLLAPTIPIYTQLQYQLSGKIQGADCLQNQLSGQFQLVDSIQNQLYGQFRQNHFFFRQCHSNWQAVS